MNAVEENISQTAQTAQTAKSIWQMSTMFHSYDTQLGNQSNKII